MHVFVFKLNDNIVSCSVDTDEEAADFRIGIPDHRELTEQEIIDIFGSLENGLYAGHEGVTIVGDDIQTCAMSWEMPPPDLDAQADMVRKERDRLLAQCDWTQMPDAPLTADAKAQWQAYRQALRDVPEQEGFPMDVGWPERL